MNLQTVLNFALGFLFPGRQKEFSDLLERLIIAAETQGGDGDQKKRVVLRALLEWAKSRGFLATWPQALREAVLSLAIEGAVYFMSQAMKLNRHKADLYAPTAKHDWRE